MELVSDDDVVVVVVVVVVVQDLVALAKVLGAPYWVIQLALEIAGGEMPR